MYEKIALILVGIVFFINFLDTEYLVPFVIVTWCLSLSYCFAGFWLFNSNREDRKFFLPIAAGIAFGIAIFLLPFAVRLKHNDMFYLYFFPIPNIVLCVSLLIYLIINRKTGKISKDNKNIFKRSVIILIISCFFMYLPITFPPYRMVLKVLTISDNSLHNNVLMFDYYAKSQKALKKEKYDMAIEYALKANEAGKIWLELGKTDKEYLDSVILHIEDTMDLSHIGRVLYGIEGSYGHLYYVYRDKAHAEWDKAQYENALKNYKTAHKYLLVNNIIYESNEMEIPQWLSKLKAWSLHNIALCYQKLKQYDVANSLFLKAILHYKSITEDEDKDLAVFFFDMAFSLSESRDFEASTICFLNANSILLKDTSNNANKEYIIDGFNEIAANYCEQGYPQQALPFLEQAEKFIYEKGLRYRRNLFYKGRCAYELNEYLKADSIFRVYLQYNKKQPQTKDTKWNIAVANGMLAHVNIALAKYDTARKYVNEAVEITEKICGKYHSQYAECLTILASLNTITGDYFTADKQYKHIIGVYEREPNEEFSLAYILSEYSQLELIFANFESAKRHSDNLMSLFPDSLLILPSMTHFMNNTAYVNYCVGLYNQADTLYKKVLSINENHNLPFDPTSMRALNGLGLIEMAKKNYKKADSLFVEALKVHAKYIPYNHPSVAAIYLNWSVLQIKENKIDEAAEKLNEAYTIYKKIFPADHDVFADILAVKGDIAKKRGQNDTANAHYQQALNIYKKKFPHTHWKVKEMEGKIRR